MPTYAPNFTPRYRAHYVAAGVIHTAQVRAARDAASLGAIAQAKACLLGVFGAFTSLLADDFAWISAEFCQQDDNLFDPVDVPDDVTGAVADWATDWSPVKRVSFIEFSGRGRGTRTSIKVYGLNIDNDTAVSLGATGIISAAVLPGIDDATAVLSEFAHTGAGTPAFWYSRVTHKTNDRLLANVRQGFITSIPA